MAPAGGSAKAAAVTTTPQLVAAQRSAEDLGSIHWSQDRWDGQQVAQWSGYVAGVPAVCINRLVANPTHPGGWMVTVRGRGAGYFKSLSAAQEEASNVLAETGEALVGLFQAFADLAARNAQEMAEAGVALFTGFKALVERAEAEKAAQQRKAAAAAALLATFDASAFNARWSTKYRAASVAKVAVPVTRAKVKPALPRPAVEPPRLLTPTPIKAKAEPTRSGIEDAILRVLAGTKQTDAEIALLIEQPVDLVRRHRLHLVKVKAVVETGKKGRSTLWSTAQ